MHSPLRRGIGDGKNNTYATLAGGWDSYRGVFLNDGWGAGFQKSGDRLSKTERRGEPDGTSLKSGGCPGGGGRTGRDASSFALMRVDRAAAAA